MLEVAGRHGTLSSEFTVRLSPSSLAKFCALSPLHQRTLLVAAAWMPFFWLSLWVVGLPRLRAWTQRRPLAADCRKVMQLSDIQALGDLVNVAARHTVGPRNCLTRSLVLDWLLRRRSIESQLRIGVRLDHGALNAHAWVECQGVPVNDEPDVSAKFAAFGDLLPLSAFHAP